MTMAAGDSKVDNQERPADAHQRPADAASRTDAARKDRVRLGERRPGPEPREDLAGRGERRCRLGRSAERHQAAPLARAGRAPLRRARRSRASRRRRRRSRPPPPRARRASLGEQRIDARHDVLLAAAVSMPAARESTCSTTRAANPSSPQPMAVLTASGTASTIGDGGTRRLEAFREQIERGLALTAQEMHRRRRHQGIGPGPPDLALATLLHDPGQVRRGLGRTHRDEEEHAPAAIAGRACPRHPRSLRAPAAGSRPAAAPGPTRRSCTDCRPSTARQLKTYVSSP